MSDQRIEAFKVILNEVGHYAMWPANEPIPKNFSEVGVSGDKTTCRDYIKANWVGYREVEDEDDWD